MARSARLGTVRNTPRSEPRTSATAQAHAESKTVARSPCRSQPRYVVSPVGSGCRKTWKSSGPTVAGLLDRLVVRRLEERLHLFAEREVEVQVARRDGVQEPFRVDLLRLAGRLDARDGAIDERLELRVALAHRAAVRLARLRRAGDDPVVAPPRLRQFSVEEDVVEHERRRASRLEDEERLAVVLGARDLDVELFLLVELAKEPLGGGPGADHGVLPGEIGEVLDAGILAGEEPCPDDEQAVREGDLLLALEIVGGGAALDVHRAVLHERDPVLRGDRDELHLQARRVQFLLQRRDDLEGEVLRVADHLLLIVVIRERNRRLAVADGDDPALLDLAQGGTRILRRESRKREGNRDLQREAHAAACTRDPDKPAR